MERLTKIEQLKKGVKFHIIRGEEVLSYEYLCVHPNNESYILAIDSISKDAKKMYIKKLLEDIEVYVGEFDTLFFLNKEIEYHQKMINLLKKREENIKNKRL